MTGHANLDSATNATNTATSDLSATLTRYDGLGPKGTSNQKWFSIEVIHEKLAEAR